MVRQTSLVFGFFITLVVLCLLLLAVLPGSWLARQASGLASSWLELPVDLEELAVKPFSLTPTVTLRSLDIPAASDSTGLHVNEIIVRLNLAALLKGDAVIERLSISDANLDIRIDEQGQADWNTHAGRKPARLASMYTTLRDTRIDDLVLNSFSVNFVNTQLHTRLSLAVEGVASTHDASKMSRLHVTGFADGQAIELDAKLSFLGDLLRLPGTGSAPLTVDVTASVGDDKLAIKGSFGKPASLKEVDAFFSMRISSLEHWQAFSPTPLPELPSLALAGRLTRDHEDWLLQQIEGQLGGTDISGEIRVDPSNQPMTLKASLTSATLAIDELKHLRQIAIKPIPVHGSIDYRAEQVVSERWPLDSIDLSALLDERQLSVLIDRVKLRSGELEGEIVRDLQSQPVSTQIRLTLKRLDLQQMLSPDTDDSLLVGQMAARVDLSVTGETRSAMRGSVEGVLITLMTGDWLDTLLQESLGIELARSLMVERGAPEKRGQNCAFVELQASEGIVQLRSLIFDTDTVVYLGDGEFDWKNQSIDLTIEPHNKTTVAGAGADGVYISGELSAPVVESVHSFLTRDSAVSLLDATMTPAVALMPYLNKYSDGADVLCQGLASALDDPR